MALKDSATGKVIRDYSIEQLKDAANLMRGYDLVTLCAAGSGHAGGTLSIMDITAALYLHVAQHDPNIPTGPTATASSGPPATRLRPSISDWPLPASVTSTTWSLCASSTRAFRDTRIGPKLLASRSLPVRSAKA